MKYPDWTLGQTEALLNRLGGVDRAKRLIVGEFNLIEKASAFERNEHGHLVLTIAPLDLSGVQEIERLEGAGFRVGNYAKSCLASTKKDGYDAVHRIKDRQALKVVLVPGAEIKRDRDRTTEGLRKYAQGFGYTKPLGGIIPRIREAVSDEVKEGDQILVKVLEVDRAGKIRLSRKETMPAPAGAGTKDQSDG